MYTCTWWECVTDFHYASGHQLARGKKLSDHTLSIERCIKKECILLVTVIA